MRINRSGGFTWEVRSMGSTIWTAAFSVVSPSTSRSGGGGVLS